MGKDRKIDMVILGLLAHEDSTGYDIKKKIDGPISFFWKGSFGSIYPALSDMEKNGLVKKLKSDNSGGREKIAYHITKKGTDTLKTWLRDESAGNELKYETLLNTLEWNTAPSDDGIDPIDLNDLMHESELVPMSNEETIAQLEEKRP